MALRAEPTGTMSSAKRNLPIYWSDAAKLPELEWETRVDSFEVTLMAKNNISITESAKTTGTKIKSPMGGMAKMTAAKNAKSVLYLALGMAATKTISDKFPTVNIARITLTELITRCKECFEKPENETLEVSKQKKKKEKR